MTTKSTPSNANDPVALDPRTRRVLELRRQVAEGTYVLDAEAVAAAMLAEWAAQAEDEQSVPPFESMTGDELAGAMGRFVVPGSPGAPVADEARGASRTA